MTTQQALLYCEGLAKMATHTKEYLERRVQGNRINLDTQVAIVDGLINYAKNFEFVMNYSGKRIEKPHPLQPKNEKTSIHELSRKIRTMLSEIEDRAFQISMEKTDEALAGARTLTEGT